MSEQLTLNGLAFNNWYVVDVGAGYLFLVNAVAELLTKGAGHPAAAPQLEAKEL